MCFEAGRRVFLVVILSFLLAIPVVLAQVSSSITDKTQFDRNAVVSTAPAYSEESIYSNFSNNESVQLYNGNLLVKHPSSPVFPVDGGGSFGLLRAYNSQRLIDDQIRIDDYGNKKLLLNGESWTGYGWQTHLGRITRSSQYTTANAIHCQSGESWCHRKYDYRFESSDGSAYLFNSDAYKEPPGGQCMKTGQTITREIEPLTRVIYYRGAGQPASACEMSGMRPNWCDTRTDVVAPECSSYGYTCDVSSDGTAHYEVTLSDGTWLRLEKRVEETNNWRAWIRNHDRAGWYTTRIQYPDGGSVKVIYHTSVPEAIQRIESEQYPTTYWIETTLWSVGDPGYVTGTSGMLKEVRAPLPNGQQWIAKFHYTTVQDDLGEGTVTLKLLQSVTFPAVNGETPTITYGYAPGTPGSAFGNPGHGYLLNTITYPTGGVSQYFYSNWTCGVGKKQHDPENDAGPRTCTAAVFQRALYPEGLSGPKSIWKWERKFKATKCAVNTLGTGIENYFRVTGPDGLTTESTAYDSPCGNFTSTGVPLLERPGQFKAVRSFQSGTGSPVVRTVERTFFDEPNACVHGEGGLTVTRAVNELGRDTSTVQTETTTYHDEKTQCFESGSSSATKTMTTHYAHRDAWNVPQMMWVTGD